MRSFQRSLTHRQVILSINTDEQSHLGYVVVVSKYQDSELSNALNQQLKLQSNNIGTCQQVQTVLDYCVIKSMS